MSVTKEQKEMLLKALEELKKNPESWHRGDFFSERNPERQCILGKCASMNIKIDVNFTPFNKLHKTFKEWVEANFKSYMFQDIAEINDGAIDLKELEEELFHYFEHGYLR